MGRFQKYNLLNYIAILLVLSFGLLLKGFLPSVIPTHFENGVSSKFASTLSTVLFLPIVSVLAVWLLTFLVKRNEEFWDKEDNQVSVALTNLGIILLLGFMNIGTLLNAYDNVKYGGISFFSLGFGAFFIVSAPAMKKIERNLFYGIRLPWTMSSSQNWKLTHEFTGKLMLPSGVLLVVIGLFTKNPALILGLIALTLFVPMIYSFTKRNK
jgi:uncharacterized membrane protein